MRWIASPEPDTAAASLEKRLWSAADQFCANSGLKAQEHSGSLLSKTPDPDTLSFTHALRVTRRTLPHLAAFPP